MRQKPEWLCRAALMLGLAIGMAQACPTAAQALEADGEVVTITLPPQIAARPHIKKTIKAVAKKPQKHVAKGPTKKPALVARERPSPAATPPIASPQQAGAAYPLPENAVPIPPDAFATTPAGATPSPPIAAGAPVAAAPASTAAIPLPSPPAQMQPLLHARNAGVTQCFDALSRASATAIDADHDAFSTWSTGAPNAHLFQSIAMMRYDNQIAPRSASVLLVTPNAANSCEGGTVQVVPSARPCADIQAQLMQGGKELANLTGLPLIENVAGIRQILLPSPNNGCVMISVGLIAGATTQAK